DARAVLAQAVGLQRGDRLALEGGATNAMVLGLLLFRNVGHRATEDFLFRPAEDTLGRRVPQFDPALRVEGLERQRRGPDHRLERLVALPERLLRPLAFGQQLLGAAPRRFGLRPGGLLLGEPDPQLFRLFPRRRLSLNARPM